jgi:hypothetical protein
MNSQSKLEPSKIVSLSEVTVKYKKHNDDFEVILKELDRRRTIREFRAVKVPSVKP